VNNAASVRRDQKSRRDGAGRAVGDMADTAQTIVLEHCENAGLGNLIEAGQRNVLQDKNAPTPFV
jgi:hypothetical protein